MNEDNILQVTTPQQAAKKALDLVKKEREGKQLGLKVRFKAMNIALRKYFRFGTVNLWAGLSGSGKSYLLQLITQDWLDYEKEDSINYNIDFIPIILHFCFEMSSETEILRSCANDLKINYNYLLSSYYNKDSKEYNRLTDEELEAVESYLEFYSNKSILFFETAGNVKLIYNTVKHYYTYYTNLANKKNLNNPNKKIKFKFIINLDHTLLVERLGERDALELMANIGKVAITIRKEFDGLVNLVGQLNNNIENTDRLTKPALHYPIKSDIYAQGQLYNACDSVFVVHQPSMLKIKTYGTKSMPTPGLIHFLILKARHGEIGSIWLLNLLSEGQIVPYPKNYTVEEDENIQKNIK